MRKTIIAGNWKMNHLGADAKETIQGLVAKVPQDVNRKSSSLRSSRTFPWP